MTLNPPIADTPGHADAAQGDDGRLLTPGQVAELFGVDGRTVTRWARAGRLPARRTLGGHRRFRLRDVAPLLELDQGDKPAGDRAGTSA